MADGLEALVALLAVVEAGADSRDGNVRVRHEGWGRPSLGGLEETGFDVAVDGDVFG